MNQTEQDILKLMFEQMPEEVLPPTFQSEMMLRIRAEAVRIVKRNNRLRILALIAASITIIGLSVAALIYLGVSPTTVLANMDFPSIKLDFPAIPFLSYYLYFGLLVLILLLADLWLRQAYYKRHQEE